MSGKKNRAGAQAFILEQLTLLDSSKKITKMYEELFAKMDDQAFDAFMVGIKNIGGVPIIAKNFDKSNITVENNIKLAASLGYSFFQKLIIKGKPGLPDHMSPVKFMVLDLPVKRQSQNLVKKLAIPEDNKTTDMLTAQPTSNYKGAKMSYPEMQILSSMGLYNSIVELVKYRGGDKGGFGAYNAMILRFGSANLKTLSQYATGVESTKTLKTILTAMHIRSNL